MCTKGSELTPFLNLLRHFIINLAPIKKSFGSSDAPDIQDKEHLVPFLKS